MLILGLKGGERRWMIGIALHGGLDERGALHMLTLESLMCEIC